MLNHTREAVDLLGTASLEDLARDRLRRLALVRLFEVVGEAANRVSAETQRRHGTIPWAAIVGMRNRLQEPIEKRLVDRVLSDQVLGAGQDDTVHPWALSLIFIRTVVVALPLSARFVSSVTGARAP